MDTGNYKINWANTKPLVFGHPESINGKTIEGFAIDPPQKKFPEGYLQSSYNTVGFNYKSISNKLPIFNVSEDVCKYLEFEKYCNDKDNQFYNPNREKFVSADIISDYQKYNDQEYYCENNKAVLPGHLMDMPETEYTEGHFENLCGTYKCNGYESFEFHTVDADNKEVTYQCTKNNINESFSYPVKFISGKSHRVLKVNYCPDPERFCRTIKLDSMNFNKDPMDEKSKVLEGDPQTPPEWSLNYDDLNKEISKNKAKKAGKIVGYVMIGVAVVVIICIVVYFAYFRKKSEETHSTVVLDNLNNDRVV